MEEGEEETERQRMDDQDYQFPSNPSSQQSTQSSTAEDEDMMRESAPQRCMTRLESLSAVASRMHLTNAQGVLAGNASYEDLGIIGPKTTLDPAKLLRARITFGDLRTESRIGPAKKNVAVMFDERINTTVRARP